MNIDIVIGNPPYQECTGGGKSGGTAIWTNFIELAKALSNKTIVMVTPSRWFTGGQGISKDWRKNWINDIHLDTLIHYSDASELFPGTSIAGGVSYFRWSKEINNYGEADMSKNMVKYENVCLKQALLRQLNEDEVVNAIVSKERQSIISKVKKYCLDNNIKTITNGFWGEHYAAYTHSVTPGNSDYKNGEIDILILNNRKPCIGKIEKEKIKYTPELNTYRVVVGGVGAIEKEKDNWVIHNIGVIKPGVVHNNSFLTLVFDGKEETCVNAANYLKLKLPRLLIMHVSASALSVAVSSYRLVPLLDFSRSYTDEDLYKIFGLTPEEIQYIESTIKSIG